MSPSRSASSTSRSPSVRPAAGRAERRIRMGAAMTSERPGGGTVSAIIVLLNGLLTTIGAIIGLVNEAEPASSIVSLIIGILTLVVGAGLLGGSRLSRLLTTIVLVLALAGAIFNMGATGFETWAIVWPILS